MRKYRFSTLDDLDKTDILKNFDEAYESLEAVSAMVTDEPEYKKRVNSVIDALNEVAAEFEDAAFQYDPFEEQRGL